MVELMEYTDDNWKSCATGGRRLRSDLLVTELEEWPLACKN